MQIRLLFTILLIFSALLLAPGAKAHQSATDKVKSILNGELSYVLTPTVYFLPTMVQDLSSCRKNSRTMIQPDGKPIVKVCADQYNQCLLQGTCKIVQGDASITVHFHSIVKQTIYFHQVELNECPFGFGVRENLCLDPYFSIAADMSYYNPGDVIFVPAVRGLVLADGRTHNGYFVVRDTGSAIRGLGRFDFYIGQDDPLDSRNPFLQLKLNDPKTRVEFQVVKGELAERVKSSRHYPSVSR
jgi:hypothetical protein